MSCIADYYFEWNGRLDSTLQTSDFLQLRTIKNARKYPSVNIGTLVSATNIGSTDYSALTMYYSRNSLC
jgi:hypothetical protein